MGGGGKAICHFQRGNDEHLLNPMGVPPDLAGRANLNVLPRTNFAHYSVSSVSEVRKHTVRHTKKNTVRSAGCSSLPDVLPALQHAFLVRVPKSGSQGRSCPGQSAPEACSPLAFGSELTYSSNLPCPHAPSRPLPSSTFTFGHRGEAGGEGEAGGTARPVAYGAGGS